ncbi:MFS transporter [Rhodococcus enclensis]|nr:MFS transporter [Rhodococcus erythropolis]MBT2274187.1 MFS transporter [Rhodococcus qingshengii]
MAAAVAAAVLPRKVSPNPSSSRSIVRSMPGLLTRHRSLRWASVSGALWFFAFNVVWVGMALALSREPYSLSASSIGLYGLAGALGLATNWPAGKLTDRWGSRRVMVLSLLVAALAAISLTAALDHPVWIAASLALFEDGETILVEVCRDQAGNPCRRRIRASAVTSSSVISVAAAQPAAWR